MSEDLFRKFSSVTDQFATTVTCKGISPDEVHQGGKRSGGGGDFTVDIHGILTSMSLSHKDTQQTDKRYDVFLLSYLTGFTPTQEINMYHIVLRPLNNASEAFTASDTESSGHIENRDNDGHMDWYKWTPDASDREIMADVAWLKTSPSSTDNTTSTTVGTSTSYSGIIGFFGGTGTGGADMSYTMSNSQTVTMIPVKIIEHSGNAMMQYSFVPQQQRDTKFEPVVEGILEIPDDGQGKRNNDINDTEAKRMALELRVTIVPVQQSVMVSDSGFMGSVDNV